MPMPPRPWQIFWARMTGEVLIGANMTTLTYQLSRSLAHQFEPGDEIIISRMEHEGNVTPWLQMAEDNGLTVKWLEFDRDSWRVEPALLEPLLSDRTRLLALNYASNLTGGVNDVKTLTAMAQAAGAIVYVDAVQFASHRLIDVVDLGCDFLACSPYKFYGPHLGIVFGKRVRLEALHAYKLRCATDELPLRFSLGTPAFELIAGLMGTLEYFQWVATEVGITADRRQQFERDYDAMGAHEDALSERLLAGLLAIPGLALQGARTLENRVATFSFTHDRYPASAIARGFPLRGLLSLGDNYAFEVARALALDHMRAYCVRAWATTTPWGRWMRRLPALSACWQGKALLAAARVSVVERKCPMTGGGACRRRDAQRRMTDCEHG